MSLEESNEITVKIKEKLDKFYQIIEEKGFKIRDEFSMNDTYHILYLKIWTWIRWLQEKFCPKQY